MTIPFDELKRLEAEATKGPITLTEAELPHMPNYLSGPYGELICNAITNDDGRLFVALRNHALPLIAAAEQAEKMAEALEKVRAQMTRHDAPWWIDSPEKGGFDLAEIDAALRAYREAVG